LKTKIIPYKFDSIDKVLHVSDIHIRNYQRHKEYISVFKQLYKEVDKLPENSIVYVGGDIVHSKTDISPELIKVTSEFLNNLANRRTTILITGNHDANLNNPSRLDTLSPIVESINNPNLHYLKDSGIYQIADVHFVVFGIFDKPSTYIKADSFEAKTKIALFHGALDMSITDVGYRVSNKDLPITMFDGYDIAMLGDIHKRQFYNEQKTILQPGSLLQQNHGESYENHGCAIWDLDTKSCEFVDFKNEWGFYTIEVVDGCLPTISNLPKYPRLRIKTTNTTQAELKNIIREIKGICKPIDITTIKTDRISSVGQSKSSQAITRDIRDVNYQNELLREYISKHHGVDSDTINTIYEINKKLNNNLSGIEITRNVNWKPKLFEFSNMFSYGANNTIDFTKSNGIVGLFAPNHTGKSAILDSLSFCLFDKCSRGRTALDIMNNKKSNFHCKLNFEVDGKDYFVERIAKKQKNGTVKVNVNFWTIENGQTVSLNGEQRRDTNRNIKSLLGTYDDFVLTSMSVQNDSSGFIEKSQTERKDLLAQFLDISIFEELYNLASDDIRDVTTLLRDFKNVDYDQQLIDEEDLLNRYEAVRNSKLIELNAIKSEIDKTDEILYELNKNLITIDVDLDIDALTSECEMIKSEISEYKEKIEKYKSYQSENVKKLEELQSNLQLIDIDNATKHYDKWIAALDKKREVTSKIELMKVGVKSKLDNLSAIGQFDPNCDFCKNTPFVKSAFKIQQQLESDKKLVVELLDTSKKLDTIITEHSGSEGIIENYKSIKNEISKYKQYQSELDVKLARRESELISHQSKLESVNDKITLYHRNEDSIKHNESINIKISEAIEVKAKLQSTLTDISDELQDIISNIKVSNSKIQAINESIDRAHTLELELKAYEYYLDAIRRNGIPYTIISDVLPYIENEVNQTLSQIVDFKIEFDVDGKNILTYIVYGDDEKWGLELTSGMEKFISSIAIRVALINISSLPRPNFLSIDEGFGALDYQNVTSLNNLFDYLKSEFDFLFVISHIDMMRDMVDDLVEIYKEKGFSKVIHV